MTIERSKRRAQYALIDQRIFDDDRLDHKALGVLVYVLSKPDHWKTNSRHLAIRFGCTKDTICKILRQLEDVGYLTRTQIQNKTTGLIEWITTIHEEPLTKNSPTVSEKTVSEKTVSGKKGHIDNTDQVITDLDQDHDPDDEKKIDPFYNGAVKAIAREVVKRTRQVEGVRNFITDAPWGELAQETGKDALTVFKAFEAFLIQRNSDKTNPDAYAKKICSSLYEKPGSEFACQPWKEFSDYYREKKEGPPRPAKNAAQDVMTPPTVVDDQSAANAREKLKKLRNGGGNA